MKDNKVDLKVCVHCGHVHPEEQIVTVTQTVVAGMIMDSWNCINCLGTNLSQTGNLENDNRIEQGSDEDPAVIKLKATMPVEDVVVLTSAEKSAITRAKNKAIKDAELLAEIDTDNNGHITKEEVIAHADKQNDK